MQASQPQPSAAVPGSVPAQPTATPLPIGFKPSRNEPWRPIEPEDMQSAGINETLLEAIIYRYLQNIGEAEGRRIADQVKLSFRLIEPLLTRLKMEQNVAYKSSTATNDYVYVLTETGRAIAQSHRRLHLLRLVPSAASRVHRERQAANDRRPVSEKG